MFDSRELMCLFDAVVTLSIRPGLADNAEAQAFMEELAAKIEKQLADQGIVFDGYCEYPGN